MVSNLEVTIINNIIENDNKIEFTNNKLLAVLILCKRYKIKNQDGNKTLLRWPSEIINWYRLNMKDIPELIFVK